MKLKLRRWDALTHLTRKPCSLILLIGKRGTGKSHLLQYLATIYKQTGKIDMAIGFSPTDESNEVLSSIIPRTLIYTDFDEGVIEKIMLEQRRRIRQGKPKRHVLLIMDDCGYDSRKIFKSNVIKNLFYNGRHMFVTLIVTLQYIMDMPSNFRTNIDVCISLRENIGANRQRLWSYFFGQFPTLAAFNMAMDATTGNYGALVCANNLTLSTDISDSVFWFRAPAEVPRARLGNPALWRLDERCYECKDLEFQTTVELRNVVAVPHEKERPLEEEEESGFY